MVQGALGEEFAAGGKLPQPAPAEHGEPCRREEKKECEGAAHFLECGMGNTD